MRRRTHHYFFYRLLLLQHSPWQRRKFIRTIRNIIQYWRLLAIFSGGASTFYCCSFIQHLDIFNINWLISLISKFTSWFLQLWLFIYHLQLSCPIRIADNIVFLSHRNRYLCNRRLSVQLLLGRTCYVICGDVILHVLNLILLQRALDRNFNLRISILILDLGLKIIRNLQ